MVLLYLSAAWVGGILTLAILWGALGPWLALAAAPLGASALVVWIACLAGMRQGRRSDAHHWQQAR